MADPDLTLPVEVNLRTAEVARPRFTPRELRMIAEQFGRSYTQIMSDDESDDRFLVMAWLKLRRDGHEVTREQMDDLVISLSAGEDEDAPADPTNGRPAGTSPRSANSGA